MLRKILTWWCANIIYRKQPYDEVCCCGAAMEDHSVFDNHTPRCQKEYAVTQWVDNLIGALGD